MLVFPERFISGCVFAFFRLQHLLSGCHSNQTFHISKSPGASTEFYSLKSETDDIGRFFSEWGFEGDKACLFVIKV